jgi:hypothetical protein
MGIRGSLCREGILGTAFLGTALLGTAFLGTAIPASFATAIVLVAALDARFFGRTLLKG